MKTKVVSLSNSSSILEAAALILKHHIGLLPVVDEQQILLGIVSLQDLLEIELPAILPLIDDLDFLTNFGAIETTRPSIERVNRPVSELMEKPTFVYEDSGLLFAYALMIKHALYDLPVVTREMKLVGIVSRVDIAVNVLSGWKQIKDITP